MPDSFAVIPSYAYPPGFITEIQCARSTVYQLSHRSFLERKDTSVAMAYSCSTTIRAREPAAGHQFIPSSAFLRIVVYLLRLQ